MAQAGVAGSELLNPLAVAFSEPQKAVLLGMETMELGCHLA